MDIEKLAAEIAADPLGVGYADLEDSAVADSLNAPIRPGKTVVPATEVRRYVLLNGLWPRIAALAQASENAVWQGTAVTILQTLAPNSFDEIRMDEPAVAAAVTQMLTTMVDAGAIGEQHRDAMVAMGDTLISRAQELGLGMVHHMHVGAARQIAGGTA